MAYVTSQVTSRLEGATHSGAPVPSRKRTHHTSQHRIVCTEQSNPPAYGHGHILAVGVGSDPSKASTRMTVAAVRSALRNGDVFYTVSPSTGKVALVRAFTCCGIDTIKSAPD